MCGISGAVDYDLGGGDRVRLMNAAMARRGPDAEGIEFFNGAVLGHRRLSIFDLSDAGKQPMTTPDGKLSVVFNGAIFNFRSLRQELEGQGHRFRTNTDTEVLLYGYRQWGIERLVSQLRGMFAFGLWDDVEHRLFLVRDRLGVKPLLYAAVQGGIAFASTARALHRSGLVNSLDPQAIAEYLEFGYVTDGRSIYSSVSKVPAATILEWHAGFLTQRRYWNTAPEPDSKLSFEEAVEETERCFLEAVRLRLDADVPVGTLLSGGVDSSLVCWAVAQSGSDITAFTVGAPGDPLDESADAQHTARLLGIRHEVINLSPEETPSIEEMVSAYGEPFACSSSLGMLRVSRAVKSSATVLLTGDGGDDVFLGYPEHLHLYAAQRIARLLPPGSSTLWNGLKQIVPHTGIARRAAHFLDYATGGLGAVTRAHPGWDVYRKKGMLGPALLDLRLPQREIPLSPSSARELLPEFLNYDRNNRFTGEYLTKVDGGTMYYGLEGRSPFLDQELWSFASRLPYAVRLHGGKAKAILRELARRKIGSRVANGKKRGFGIPANRWLVTRWRERFESLLSSSQLHQSGWISAPAVRQEYRKAIEAGVASNQLWYIFVLEHWLQHESSETSGKLTPALSGSFGGR